MNDGHSYVYDVFICHASEDKDSFIRPLAEELSRRGLHVWYDEFSLRVGDSLRRSIERGLTNSRHGIVVFSSDFFKKEWPQKELDGLNALENGERKIILPIWHGITKSDVMKYSPILADRVAINSTSGLDQVVSELLRVVRPKDKYEKLLEAAIQKWVAHGILPSVEELYTLCENVNPEQLTRDQMAFLYCAYLSRDDELQDWIESNRPVFSFGYVRDYLFKKANLEESILSSLHIKKGGIGMIGKSGGIAMVGCSTSQLRIELDDVVLYEMTVKEDHGEFPALYFCIQDHDNRGLEVLMVRGVNLKSYVRFISQISDENMYQLKLQLINMEEEE